MWRASLAAAAAAGFVERFAVARYVEAPDAAARIDAGAWPRADGYASAGVHSASDRDGAARLSATGCSASGDSPSGRSTSCGQPAAHAAAVHAASDDGAALCAMPAGVPVPLRLAHARTFANHVARTTAMAMATVVAVTMAATTVARVVVTVVIAVAADRMAMSSTVTPAMATPRSESTWLRVSTWGRSKPAVRAGIRRPRQPAQASTRVPATENASHSPGRRPPPVTGGGPAEPPPPRPSSAPQTTPPAARHPERAADRGVVVFCASVQRAM